VKLSIVKSKIVDSRLLENKEKIAKINFKKWPYLERS
tara:strand:+ start:67 stop:177 length:111 start_codon:yes stop_codon:yes gene_type:complete